MVSIGMPVYNSEQHIEQALDSLLAQDWEDWELIISDNKSTDGTGDICLEYAARDRRIRYYRNERNMGMVWNSNRVFELSSGTYFKWAGSHDYVSTSFITACKRILDSDPSVVLAYPLTRLIGVEDQTITDIVPECVDTRGLPTRSRVLMVVSTIEYCGIEFYGLFRASALRRCRRLLSAYGNDHVLMMEISVLGAIALVPEVLFFRRDFGPISKGDEKIAAAILRLNPDHSRRKRMRPHWKMGIQQLIGAWRLTPLSCKFQVVPLIAYTFYSRWRKQLKRELLQPYSLKDHVVPDY